MENILYTRILDAEPYQVDAALREGFELHSITGFDHPDFSLAYHFVRPSEETRAVDGQDDRTELLLATLRHIATMSVNVPLGSTDTLGLLSAASKLLNSMKETALDAVRAYHATEGTKDDADST